MTLHGSFGNPETLRHLCRVEVLPIGEDNRSALLHTQPIDRCQYVDIDLIRPTDCGRRCFHLPHPATQRAAMVRTGMVEDRPVEIGPVVTDLGPLPGPERPQAGVRHHVLGIERTDEPGGESHQVVGVLAIDLFVSHYTHKTLPKAFLGDTLFQDFRRGKPRRKPKLVFDVVDTQEETRKPAMATWLLLAGIFVGAVIVTVYIGTRGDAATDDAHPDLGGIAESDPNLPDNADDTYPDLGDIAESDPNLPNNAEPAPTFALPTLGGEAFDLAGHFASDGRPVILNLWASWCPPCRAEMPAIETSSLRHPDVAFVGVAVKDTSDKAAAFAEEIGISYTIAFDDGSVDDAYQVLALPATFFIDGNGTLVKSHFGVVTIDSLDDDIAELFGS